MFKISDLKKNHQLLSIAIACIFSLGIGFRFYNLEGKTYWHDEVYTSMRVAGYNGDLVVEREFTGKVISPQQLLQYQQVTSAIGYEVTLKRLIEHPEHPPLFYILSRCWQDIFGSSVTSSRALAATLSLLVFPGIYWLCWELFTSVNVGLVAIAIAAISPVHVLYAQEARQYGLWAGTILLATAALARAIKTNRITDWLIYAIALALNFYTSLLSLFVGIAYGVYFLVAENFRPTKKTLNFVWASILAVILFVPWLGVILARSSNLQDKTSWTSISRSFIDLLVSWELHLSSVFIDLHPQVSLVLAPRIALVIFLFISYTIYYLIAQTPLKVWLLVVSLIIIPAAGLILPDLISGGQKSIMTRYFFPSIIGIQVAIAYWLVKAKSTHNSLKTAIICMITILGIISCLISSQADTWWNKVVSYHNPEIAAIINQYERPLLISNNNDINVGNLVSLAYLLAPQVKLLLTTKPTVPTIPQGNFSEVLIWNTGEKFADEFKEKNNCTLEMVGNNYYPLLFLAKRQSEV